MKNRFTPLHRALFGAAVLTAASLSAQAQGVGVGTTAPDASAALDIVSTTKGALLPRVASTGSVTSPATGLIVFQTGSPAGFYYNSGTTTAPVWQQIATAAGTSTGFIQNQNAADQVANFRISGSGSTLGNFGVGTSAPQLRLDVANGNIGLRNNAAWDHMYWFHDGSTAFMRAGGAETGLALQVGASATGTYGDASQAYRDVMRLLPNGNVGIGTTTPIQKLEVEAGGIRASGNGAFTAVLATNQGAHLQWNRTGGEGETWLINHMGGGNGNAGIRFAGITTGTGTVPTEWARFNNAGNFGIGTTAPSALLDVAGNARIEGLTTAGVVTTDALGNLSSGTAASLDPTTASNGLTTVGSDFRLGGTLTAATTIGLGANSLSFTSTTGTVGIGAISAARLHVRGLGNAYPATTGTTQSAGLINRFQTSDNAILDLGGNSSNGFWLQSTDITTLGLNYPLMLNPNGGNVGVGTTTPLAKLAVNGAQVLYAGLNNASARPAVGTARIAGEIGAVGQVAGTTPDLTADDGFLRLSAGGGGNPLRKSYIDLSGFSNNADMNENIVLGTINTERMRITNGGNVGIGTNAPTSRLHVVGGNLQVDGSAAISNQGAYLMWNRSGFEGETWLINQFGGGGAQQHGIRFGESTTANVVTEYARFGPTGNFGIGTTAPTEKLDVVGNIQSSANIAVDYGNANLGTVDNTLRFGPTNSGEGIGSKRNPTGNQYGMDFYTRSANRMAITNLGNVGIGTTTPTALLDVAGSTRLRGLTTAGLVQTDAAGNLSSATAASLDPTTASNGLTKVGSDFRLGGTLAAATTIAQGGNAFSLTGGNVGIGITAPIQKLEVEAGGIRASGNGAFTAVSATNQGAHLQWNRSNGEGETWLINHMGGGNGNAGIRFAGITTGTGTVPTEWARFNNAGNFGIGTTAPSATLEVAGYTKLSGPTAVAGATVPSIATAMFTGTLPTTANTNGFLSLGGIATSRILSVSITALANNVNNYFPPNQTASVGFGTGYEYGYYLETNSNTLRLVTGANSVNVQGGAVKVLVTYMP